MTVKFLPSLATALFCMAMFLTVTMNAQTTDKTTGKAVGPQYVITVKQSGRELGKMVLQLWPDVAPKHCAFFEARVAEGWYDGSAFHRVIPNFMIQGGDPKSKTDSREAWGTGGWPEKVAAEFSSKKHSRGVVSAARTNDPNSFGGQFFICVGDASWLDGQYTAFGEILSGMEVADAIVAGPRDARDNPLEKVEMTIQKKSEK